MLNQLSLDGLWKILWSDGQRGRSEYANRDKIDLVRYFDAQVPGEVHLDLMRAGVIADPYVGTNCLSARWVEECIWSYHKEFEVPAEAMQDGRRCWLNFAGLDYAAVIVLNGTEIGKHANFFRPCRIEVTGKLRPGTNVLTVHLDGGLFEVTEKPYAGYGVALDAKLHKRHWLRKPQCQFSWDWSTRLINVGIHKSVNLEWTSAPARADRFVPLASLSDDLKTGTLRGRWFVENLTGKPLKVGLKLAIEDSKASIEKETEIPAGPGLHPVEAEVQVSNPALWWPVGHGEQNLHTVQAELTVGNAVIAQKSATVGFRHVRINQDPHPKPEGGRYFIVEINHKPIFCKGGNFVPADMIFARLDKARYGKLVDLALEANFNLLRIWGGGLYESDDFYDLCNRKGILVWQEFIYACAKYPIQDQIFYDNVKAEAVYQVRRLAAHPSLVIWCGNNEMEWGAWSWGYENGVTYPDYALFHLTLPRVLKEEDPTRYYQPSSPYSPDGLNPNADEAGDQHPWSVGFQDTDFRKYRKMISRFPNEGGILGPTALPTMLACLPEGHRFPQSFAWQVHDNSVDSWGEPSYPDEMIRLWIGLDVRKMSIEDFTYFGGLVQGEGLSEYINNFRRRMFSSASAIFWMYNDCWPATRSWTIVDYYLRRTPAFWAVKRAMAPVSVVLVEETDEVKVFGVNETSAPIQAELRFGIFELAGNWPVDRRQPVTLPSNASTLLASFPRSQWVNPNASLAFASLEKSGHFLARNRLTLPYFKEMTWPKPEVSIKVKDGRATFSSRTFAWGVCLDLDGETPLADNFFDLWPGVDYTIPWPHPSTPKVLRTGNL